MLKLINFLGEHVFRFRYQKDTSEGDNGNLIWDIGIYEDNLDKMSVDLFVMGLVVGVVIAAIVGGALWLTL